MDKFCQANLCRLRPLLLQMSYNELGIAARLSFSENGTGQRRFPMLTAHAFRKHRVGMAFGPLVTVLAIRHHSSATSTVRGVARIYTCDRHDSVASLVIPWSKGSCSAVQFSDVCGDFAFGEMCTRPPQHC
jgi:hypothetical protein